MAENMAIRASSSRRHYSILLIITDRSDCVEDLRHTISALIYASKMPISIVFVGVGERNCDELERLASAGAKLSINGRRAQRDILQVMAVQIYIDIVILMV